MALRRRGLTLVELLIAATLMSLTAAAAFSMLFVASRSSSAVGGELLLRQRGGQALLRLGRMVRGARRVQELSASRLLIWYADDFPAGAVPGDDVMQIFEILEVTHDTTQRRLVATRVSSAGLTSGVLAGLMGAVDISGLSTGSLASLAAGLGLSANVVSEVWSQDVQSFSFTAAGNKSDMDGLSVQLAVGDSVQPEVLLADFALTSRANYLSDGNATNDGLTGMRKRRTVIP